MHYFDDKNFDNNNTMSLPTPPSDAVFVSINRGDDANDGSFEHPVKNIQTGITKAQGKGFTKVWIEEGTYTISVDGGLNTLGGVGLSLVSNIYNNFYLSGGWKSDFVTQTGVTILNGTGLANSIINVTSADNIILENFEITGSAGGSDGGGINFSTVNNGIIRNCNIHDNSVTQNGGGIRWYSVSNSTIQSCNIFSNSVIHNGGGIYMGFSSNNTINSSTTIRLNTASSDYGGGIYIYSCSSVNYIYASIDNNVANYQGGGIYIVNSFNQFINANISGNHAQLGGGILIASGSGNKITGNITNNYINTSGGSGGGILLYNSNNIIGDPLYTTTFSNNYTIGGTPSHGGAIAIQDASNGGLIIQNVTFSGNYDNDPATNATIYFGNYAPSGTLTIRDNRFYVNTTDTFIYFISSINFTPIWPNYSFTNNLFENNASVKYYVNGIGTINNANQININLTPTGSGNCSGNGYF